MERPFTYSHDDGDDSNDSAVQVDQDLYYEFATSGYDGIRTQAYLYPLAQEYRRGRTWEIALRASNGDSFRSFVPQGIDCIEYPDGEVSLSVSTRVEPLEQYDEVAVGIDGTPSEWEWWPIREAFISEIHGGEHNRETGVQVYTNVTFDV